ncbi:RND transporter [Sinimarinibacterium sp. CAU 1509]|nr:RND transporter [Sinimarinibacterium sp. CAU 1509]
MSLRERIAVWLIAHRLSIGILFAAATAFFAVGIPHVELRTVFSDLLPRDDPFVQVFKDHPDFGNPLTMLVMVRCKDGSIYNRETLDKVWRLTRDIDLAPAVNHDQIVSIASSKARYAEAKPYGIDMRPLMGDHPPQTDEEIALLRERTRMAPMVARFLVSEDERATILSAQFIEHRLEYGETFEYMQALIESARDDRHEIHLAGYPALTGWVYRYEAQMLAIFALTIAALITALALRMRHVAGVIVPIAIAAMAAVWAVGLVGWLGISIEPLLMIVPLLLIARSFSHGVQLTERYVDIYAQVRDKRRAAELTMSVMMVPGLTSILTDVVGIIVVAVAPIDAMVRHAIFCGMWALWLIPAGVVWAPMLLSILPTPKVAVHRDMTKTLPRLLRGVGELVTGRRVRWTGIAVAAGAALVVLFAQKIEIGNPVEGSNLLHANSEFNVAVRKINNDFPGVNTLELILEAKRPELADWTAQQVDTVLTMTALQQKMEASGAPPRASLSYADYLAETSRIFNGGNTRWLPLDPDQRAISAAAVGSMMGTSAANFGHVISDDLQHATVSLWYADNRQSTVDTALAAARDAVLAVGIDHPEFRVRLGSGVIALQEAVNRVVQRYHWIVLALLNLAMVLMGSLAYRSWVAGFLLLVPVNLSNWALLSTMYALGIGLDVNSTIVAAIGIGVGIDYGIYLLSRICEEYGATNGDWKAAICASLATTGSAIAFTATVMALGILPWYFLSGLKFVADMGLLLVVIMGINMLLSLVVLPLLVFQLKPTFVSRATVIDTPRMGQHDPRIE